MEVFNPICPKSPYIWNGKGFSECFDDILLGFGPNLITLVLIAVLGFSRRNYAQNFRISRMQLPEKIFWNLFPALGLCLSFYDVVLLWMQALQGHNVAYHAWLFRCSQVSVWAIIILLWRWDYWILVFCSQILCFWWIVKPFLSIPRLLTVFSSSEVLKCLKESCSILVDIAFGIFLNFTRIRQTSSKRRKYDLLEDPLLACDSDIEQCQHSYLNEDTNGGALSYWNLLTFKSINLVMERGSKKQLDFDDLAQLPLELSPSSCHGTLLSCWEVEQSKCHSHPSLFRAICSAYGWPYLCLGLLKIVTDQASNYKLAGKWIMEESKIYWTPCAAHCVNLMLSDVSDLPLVHDLVEEAKCVTIFIYNHTKVLHLMRNHTDGRDIVRPSVTRFATSFLCLQSIFEQKQRLRNMIASPEWTGSKWANTPTGKDVRRSIKRSTFWNHMHYALKIMAPLVDVVRLVDTEEKPSMGYIYKAMEICKEKVKKNLGEENEEDKEMWKVVEAIIDDRWKAQLNQPLHAAAYYLNPMFYYATPTSPEEMESNGPVKEGLLECITKLTGDLVEEKKIIVQLVAWRTRRGRLGKPNAVACVNDMAPVEWWVTFGSEIPELQRFAKRVLGLTTSASPCERNWSTFSNVINDCIGFASPLLLNKLIWFLQKGSGHLDGYILAILLGLTSIIKSFLDTQYTFHLSKLKLKLRSSIMTVIYRKCISVSLAERSKFSQGEIQTFMSIDADRTVNLCNSFHDIWSLPLQIAVALYLLYTQVKFAFISGMTITILLIPVNKWLSTMIARATEKMMKQKDERIRRTGELLTYIRTLKMYGWELLFANRLKETRSREVDSLSTRKYLDAWCVFFWATTPTLFSLFTFGLFTLTGHALNAATVFTCLALFNSLISPLNSFPWVINGLIDAVISIKRLSIFLSCPEHTSERCETSNTSSPLLYKGLSDSSQPMAVSARDASCTWSSSTEEKNPVLNNITFDLPRGFLVAVVGEVGSGKSSLINSILGEMRLIHGSIHSYGSIAYVSQVSWILSGTVRDNILFGKDYDVKRYTDVLRACALDVDISLMAGGDLAYIGEKGLNLSGGQKARLALARAIYHGADIFILDDVLSAVDAKVASWILYNAILGHLMNQETRVICTHNPQAISSAHMIVVMDKGNVMWTGSLAEFSESPYSVIPLLKETMVSSSQFPIEECSTIALDDSRDNLVLEKDSVYISEEAEVVETEARKEGKVELSNYKNYAKFSSWSITILIGVSAILMQASRNGNDLWLSYWVDTSSGGDRMGHSTSFYLGILSIFCLVNSILTLVRAFSFAFGGLRAAIQVHNQLLNKLINAPVYFFDQTPTGRILNRFSSDLYTIDDSLPFILNILLANFIGLLGFVIVLSYVQVIFLILLLPFWYIYTNLQFYYRLTSRELRRLDSVSRSPIYASFTETLDGSSTIRAFKAEEYFLNRFIGHIALYQRTSYSEITASLWLSLRLQMLAAFVISFIASMAVIGCRGDFPISFGTPGLVGLALSYAAPFVSLVSSFLSSFTETEKEMVSVERVLQYMDVPQEEMQSDRSLHPDWPFQGQIEFHHVTLRYSPSLPAALREVTFTVTGGTQVGIVGRTGAGKSSILNALFRLSPICEGRILVDGVNVAGVSLRDLRSHFAVVPQSPFLFEGSLRDNLDPNQTASESKIWATLEKCHIKDEVEAVGGLETNIKEGAISFSVGQRQLLCLARALLKSSKVICLDECTANIDTRTASILQNAISVECKGMTVLTIAHRISTVLNMDNILILDQGILVEQGHPQTLLQDSYSRFSSFAKASVM